MQNYESVYRSSFWDYSNPFGIQNDPYEDLVKSRISQFGTRKRGARRQREFRPRKALKKKLEKPQLKMAEFSLEKKETKTQKKVRTQMKQSEGQTFVSSDTRPLKKTPRVIVHLPTTVSKVVSVDDSSRSMTTTKVQ